MNKQEINMLVIDKKKMLAKDAGLPEGFMKELSFFDKHFRHFPLVKAKVGPQIMTLLCADNDVFNSIVIKKEQKVIISGICILGVKKVYNNESITNKAIYSSNDFGRKTEQQATSSTNYKYVIKSSRIMSQFVMTFTWIDKFISLGDYFLIDGDNIYLLNSDMKSEIKIDLLTAKVVDDRTVHNLSNVPAYEVRENTIGYGMCNMIVNAMAQWIGGTPYVGASVCKKLSDEATNSLKKYNMSLKLTGSGMNVYKDNKRISYAQAIKTLL